MLNGERQVAPTRDGIRKDHVARYEWAHDLIPQGHKVLDIACGVGYGSALLSEGRDVTAVDMNSEAIAYAVQHYGGPTYKIGDITNPSAIRGVYDAAVAFECLEHVEDPQDVLRNIDADELFASVPNQAYFPHQPGMLLHHRHYTENEFRALLQGAGWEVVEMRHQEGPESPVGDIPGRTLVARCKKRLGHVAILGLGPTLESFVDHTKRLGGISAYCDEVWGINAVGDVIPCDRIFHMDDVRVQERRAIARPNSNIANMVRWLKQHPGPIYTSHVEPGYAGLVQYPLEKVMMSTRHAYFNGTAAYAVAYAVYRMAKRISIFGCDYSYEHSHHAERGRGCVEYWIGIAKENGIEIALPQKTSLLDACEGVRGLFYGFSDGYDVSLDEDFRLSLTPRELPTAEEIERRYDHTRPTSPHVRKGVKE